MTMPLTPEIAARRLTNGRTVEYSSAQAPGDAHHRAGSAGKPQMLPWCSSPTCSLKQAAGGFAPSGQVWASVIFVTVHWQMALSGICFKNLGGYVTRCPMER